MKDNYLLRAKVGMGPIDHKKLRESQNVIDNNEMDFGPIAMEYLEKLKKNAQVSSPDDNQKEKIDLVSVPVLNLKGNAIIVGNGLVGDLSDIMLTFLESIETLDEHVVEIISAYQETLTVIFQNNIQGGGGEYGQDLKTELKSACQRYFSKKKGDENISLDGDAFFID